MSYTDRAGGLVTSAHMVRRRLPPFFSNLLPEGHLRSYLAEKAGVNPEREFFLMAALGADVAGAVTVRPLDEGPGEATDETGVDHGNGGVDRPDVLRFSLAAVQLKFSAIIKSAGGLTIPAHGVGGSWIVKLPSARFDAVPENEFAMLALARAVGITVPENRLVSVAAIHGLPPDAARRDAMALAVERFDRAPGGQRIHMEDFAQVFGAFPEAKYKGRSYANIASVLWAEAGEQDTYDFVRRLVFSVLIGNPDMHLKNWSVVYPDGRTPVLAPAYDFVATLPYIPGDSLALSFGGSRSLDGITWDQVRRFVDTARLPMKPVREAVRETAERTAEAWRKLDQKDVLPQAMRTIIDGQLARAVRGALEA